MVKFGANKKLALLALFFIWPLNCYGAEPLSLCQKWIGGDITWGVYSHFKDSFLLSHPILYSQRNAAVFTEDNFKTVETDFPKSWFWDALAISTSGEVFGYEMGPSDAFRPTPIYMQDQDTGLFETMAITGDKMPKDKSAPVWSKVFNGLLFLAQGDNDNRGVYLLKNKQLRKLPFPDLAWDEIIGDVSDFGLVVLTGPGNHLYAIDVRYKLYDLGQHSVQKFEDFDSAVALHNPDRIVIVASHERQRVVVNLKSDGQNTEVLSVTEPDVVDDKPGMFGHDVNQAYGQYFPSIDQYLIYG